MGDGGVVLPAEEARSNRGPCPARCSAGEGSPAAAPPRSRRRTSSPDPTGPRRHRRVVQRRAERVQRVGLQPSLRRRGGPDKRHPVRSTRSPHHPCLQPPPQPGRESRPPELDRRTAAAANAQGRAGRRAGGGYARQAKEMGGGHGGHEWRDRGGGEMR